MSHVFWGSGWLASLHPFLLDTLTTLSEIRKKPPRGFEKHASSQHPKAQNKNLRNKIHLTADYKTHPSPKHLLFTTKKKHLKIIHPKKHLLHNHCYASPNHRLIHSSLVVSTTWRFGEVATSLATVFSFFKGVIHCLKGGYKESALRVSLCLRVCPFF